MRLFAKTSAITNQVDAITSLASITNWEEVSSLCEAVNAKEDGAKEAAKALRKKLRLGRPQQQMNAITLIQAMVDGCGSKFKGKCLEDGASMDTSNFITSHLATTKFAEDIEAVIIADATDANVKIRLMERLEDWSATFATDPGLAIIPQLYYALVKNNSPRTQSNGRSSQQRAPQPLAPMTEEQKLRQMAQDIELARNNAHMLIEAVSFADPETEAVEENELIKEFHSKCQTLQRGIQQYLSEMTESATPNEQWLTSLLACNQELVQAFTAYDQMMERQHLSKVTKVSEMTDIVPARAHPSAPKAPFDPNQDLMSFNDGVGAGVGNGAGNGYGHSNGNGNSVGEGKRVSPNHNGATNPAIAPVSAPDPFADEPYFTAGPADIAAAVKMGKRTDNQDNVFDASAFFRQQQIEQEQLEALKNSQRALYEQQHSGSGSSQAASSTIPVSSIP
ncbi:putative actin patch assembly and actin polymerization protein [Entomortierella chlamydospora]|uniref:Actin patch assembly and actin polymerization protein n=1 Tax=Entomortierella chlamydospora TaxID=101097 RepID=A0A9P6MU28_9FUNG|nr:putative actin patch assembly and actin polymerization protein [Entomortierella chlamydospora]